MNRTVHENIIVRLLRLRLAAALLLAFGLLASLAGVSSAQNAPAARMGKITGRLFDAETGEPLLGASVMIEGTRLGGVTDLQGNFIIRNVPLGTYTVAASMIGYGAVKVTEVVVSEDGVAKVELALKPQLVQTQGVTVEAKMLKNTEASLLKERQTSHAVSDAISSEAITRSGASDAAGAMIRVTGASVANGKYAVVRGLSDRYTNTQLNGSSLPSADPDKQAFNIDMVPTNLLDNIVVTKSYTVDKPGNFTGGSVNLVTKDFPDSRTLTFSAGSSYNSEITGKAIMSNSSSSRDWLGYDDGMRDIPAFLENNLNRLGVDSTQRTYRKPGSKNNFDSTGARYVAFLDSACKVFTPQFSPKKRTAPLNQNYAVSYGDNLPLFGRPFGFVGSLTYNRSQEASFNGQNNLYTALSSTSLYNVENLRENSGSDEVLWGGIANLNYSLANNHKLGARYVYNRNGKQETSALQGYLNEYDPGQLYNANNVDYTQRTLKSLQLDGTHEFKLGLPVRVQWNYSDSKNLQKENLRQFLYSYYVDSSVAPYDTSGYGLVSNALPTVFWRDIDESNREFNLDVKVSLSKAASVKVGGNYLDKRRTFRQTEIVWVQSASTTYLNQVKGNLDQWIQHSGLTDSSSQYYLFDQYLYFFPTLSDDYDGSQKIPAWYLMLETPVVKNLNLVTGVRHERTDMQAINLSADPFGGKINSSDWLPSLGLTYSLSPKMNLRGAYSRTLARPNLREIAPFRNAEFAGAKFFYGNPNLRMTFITNWDLRWEWFTRPNELVAVSAFYKRFTDPIEVAYLGGNYDRMPVNAPKAKNFGLEFEVRKNLDQVAHALSNFSVGGNLTVVRSRLKIPADELSQMRSLDPDASDERPMANQSPYIINLNVGYDNAKSGTAVTLLYNVFGRRFFYNADGGTPDIYEMPHKQFDLTLSQNIFRGATFKASVRNILNEGFEADYYYTGSGAKTPFQTRDGGRVFSLGMVYKVL